MMTEPSYGLRNRSESGGSQSVGVRRGLSDLQTTRKVRDKSQDKTHKRPTTGTSVADQACELGLALLGGV